MILVENARDLVVHFGEVGVVFVVRVGGAALGPLAEVGHEHLLDLLATCHAVHDFGDARVSDGGCGERGTRVQSEAGEHGEADESRRDERAARREVLLRCGASGGERCGHMVSCLLDRVRPPRRSHSLAYTKFMAA